LNHLVIQPECDCAKVNDRFISDTPIGKSVTPPRFETPAAQGFYVIFAFSSTTFYLSI
jgi:hypothetical protein